MSEILGLVEKWHLAAGLVTQLAFIYVKRAKGKNNVISYLGIPRVRNDQCKEF